MLAWLTSLISHWFPLLQTAGVVGGLLFSGWALRTDYKVRRTEVLLSLTRAHRDIWERLIERPDLGRVLDANAETTKSPPTLAERRFVQLVVFQLATAHLAIKEGALNAHPGMEEDIRVFLSLPIPREVLASLLPFQSPEFRDYLRRFMV